MRRAVLTLGSTAAGLAALLSFKSHSAAPAASASAAPSASAPAASAGGTSSARPASSPARTHQARHPGSPAAQTRTVTGAVTNTQYGPMQVRLTLVGTKITKATVLQRTDDGSESNQVDSFAIPKLESETLAAQSATIDAVSGASYTSSGYIRSLQSALDRVRA
jgi:uncharacterized protein with FMN-binding domain